MPQQRARNPLDRWVRPSRQDPDWRASEAGILHELERNRPNVIFYPAPPEVSEGEYSCSCNECEYMKMSTLKKIYNALNSGWPTVEGSGNSESGQTNRKDVVTIVE